MQETVPEGTGDTESGRQEEARARKPSTDNATAESPHTSRHVKPKVKRKGRHRFEGPSSGRDKAKGTGSRDPKQGPTPEQIQEWFGDLPW